VVTQSLQACVAVAIGVDLAAGWMTDNPGMVRGLRPGGRLEDLRERQRRKTSFIAKFDKAFPTQ
jgi:hypothetical protein